MLQYVRIRINTIRIYLPTRNAVNANGISVEGTGIGFSDMRMHEGTNDIRIHQEGA